jgi:hypothetical protein
LTVRVEDWSPLFFLVMGLHALRVLDDHGTIFTVKCSHNAKVLFVVFQRKQLIGRIFFSLLE